MNCEHPGSRNRLGSRLHVLKCRECRANAYVDQVIFQGIDRLNAELISTPGMAATLDMFRGDSTSVPRIKGRKKKSLRIRLLSGSAVTALASVGIGGWLCWIDVNPKIAYPNPVMPSPNAYDILLQAFKAIPKSELDIANKNFPNYNRTALTYALRSPAEREFSLKSAQLYERQLKANPRVGFPKTKADNKDRFYSLADKESLLRDYGNSLSLLRQSFAFPYQAPHQTSREASSYEQTVLDQKYLQLQNALKLEQEVATTHGDYSSAVNINLDIMEFGAELTQGSALQARLTANDMEIGGQSILWKLLERLTSEQSKAAVHRLERIIGKNASLVATLNAEKWETLALQEEFFRNYYWRSLLTSSPYRSENTGIKPNPVDEMIKFFLIHKFSKTDIMAEKSRVLDYNIAIAKLPYILQKDLPARPKATMLGELMFYSAASDIANPKGSRFSVVEAIETQNALLLTSLALHAYYLDHQDYPKELTELVPKYLTKVPVDPFSDGNSLQYKPSNLKSISVDGGAHWFLKLYSIGPDGIDNAGSPVSRKFQGSNEAWAKSHPDEVSQNQHAVMPDSKGDIVAGLNR